MKQSLVDNNTKKFKSLIPQGLNQYDIAREMEVTQQCVSVWINKNIVPPMRAAEFSRITGIPKSKLNPIFCEANNAEVAHG